MDAKDASQSRREAGRACLPPDGEIAALILECQALLQRVPMPPLGHGDAFERLLRALEANLEHDWG